MKRLALLCSAALLCAGGGGSVGQGSASVLRRPQGAGVASAAELAWLRKVGLWRHKWLADWLERSSKAHPLGECAAHLTALVGIPPTTRLDAGYRADLSACRLLDERRFSAFQAALDKAESLLYVGEGQPLPDNSGSHLSKRAADAAGFVAKKPVEVRCWSPSDWTQLNKELEAIDDVRPSQVEADGRVNAGTAAIQLSPRVCQWLERVERGQVTVAEIDRSWDRRTESGPILGLADATAVKVLAHEAEHARGIRNEAAAECFGLQEVPAVALRLGASRAVAREMDRYLWALYPQTEPPGYSSSQCVKGGRMDLHLSSTAWP